MDTSTMPVQYAGGGGELWHNIDKYQLDRCGLCGFVYVKNIPSDLELFKAYAEGYTKNGIYRPIIRKGRRIKYWALSKIIQVLKKQKRIKLLEIGCSQGYLLDALRNNPHFDAEGIDYAQGPVEYARSIGLKVSQSSLAGMEYPSVTFDFVVALHVIEHVQNLDTTMQEINRIMKKGGNIYVVVPCISHVKARLSGKNWKYLGPPGHLWYFTTKSLRLLLEKHGFVVNFATCISHRAHLRILATKS